MILLLSNRDRSHKTGSIKINSESLSLGEEQLRMIYYIALLSKIDTNLGGSSFLNIVLNMSSYVNVIFVGNFPIFRIRKIKGCASSYYRVSLFMPPLSSLSCRKMV